MLAERLEELAGGAGPGGHFASHGSDERNAVLHAHIVRAAGLLNIGDHIVERIFECCR